MHLLVGLPHRLVRRYLPEIERLLVGAGLAALLYGLLHSLPAYPPYWDIALLGATVAAAFWSPPGAYWLAVVTAVYPLSTLSIYIAVLFLSIAILGQRVFINNLGAVVLALSAPWLAYLRIGWVIPLLGGLWWGSRGGAWIGGLAAAWGMLAAGLSGANPDWLTALGRLPSMQGVSDRFVQANSLETLLRILEPLAPNPTALLYYLLQAAAWALVGGLIGYLIEEDWLPGPWRRAILSGSGGALALLGLQLGLAAWLGQFTVESLRLALPYLAVSAGLSAGTVIALEIGRDLVEHPLPLAQPGKSRRASRPRPAWANAPQFAAQPAASALPVAPAESAPAEPGAPPAKKENGDKDDLIMLELD
jgi:hypothetical protein